MQVFDRRITEYVQKVLGLDAATAALVRGEYYTTYGTTLRGLQNNYPVDVEDYLHYVHDLELKTFLALDAELDRLLGEVQARKVIFTNSPVEHATRVLDTLGIARHFERIFDIRFCQFLPKPAPETYALVLRELDIDGAQAVFIEDTAKNLPPAKALGVTTILLAPHGTDGAAAQADYVVPDIIAALGVVRELEQS